MDSQLEFEAFNFEFLPQTLCSEQTSESLGDEVSMGEDDIESGEQLESVESVEQNQTASHSNPSQYPGDEEPRRERSSKKRSLFHNRMKQVIITIKGVVSKSIPLNGILTSERCLASIWHAFTNLKIMDKEVLKMLYNTKFNEKAFSDSPFSHIKRSYSQDEIKEALKLLKKITLREMTDEAIITNIQSRRIVNKEHLKMAVAIHLKEIKEGIIQTKIYKNASQIVHQQQANHNQQDQYLNQILGLTFTSFHEKLFQLND